MAQALSGNPSVRVSPSNTKGATLLVKGVKPSQKEGATVRGAIAFRHLSLRQEHWGRETINRAKSRSAGGRARIP
ncbi:MAG UNVERIFIED_CONTAM: hypothetical protein LVR29_23505 [Microcystis novacekii LVE1205-3]